MVINLSKGEYRTLYVNQCDVIKFKTIAVLVDEGHSDKEKQMIFRHVARMVVCEVPCWHKSVDPEFLNFDQNSIPTSENISWHIIEKGLLVR